MKLLFLIIFNTLLFFINVSYSHENLEQHAIAHVYPELEAKYIEDEKTKCKAVIIKNSRCNTRDDSTYTNK
jgi:hypothetical protein|tara:strand:- start:670 stop:882 length:213 start_codon:yes stop_codon:yes gene_type:complete